MSKFETSARIEFSYHRALLRIARKIISLAEDSETVENLEETLKKIVNYPELFPEYISLCENAALKMITHLYAENAKDWRDAAAKAGRGREIYNLLKNEMRGSLGILFWNQVERNAKIIKTLPLGIADDVTKYVAREALKGRRASEIAKEIFKMFPAQTTARAKLIARTEVSKAQCAITEGRCRELGLNWYVWRACGGSSGDGRTRYSHKNMSGVLINWNDPPNPEKLFPSYTKSGKKINPPPNPYHAGNIYNCRCYPEPVISLDTLNFPMKIYRNGKIERISRKKFESVM